MIPTPESYLDNSNFHILFQVSKKKIEKFLQKIQLYLSLIEI